MGFDYGDVIGDLYCDCSYNEYSGEWEKDKCYIRQYRIKRDTYDNVERIIYTDYMVDEQEITKL